ncbi:MAG: sortase [Peptococcaceae bacterium]|nr:sortase [Peptococcaceae bacterium]
MNYKKSQLLVIIGLCFIMAGLLLAAYNLYDAARASASVSQVIENIDTGQELKENEIPDYILNPQMAMPEQEIDGHKYIGTLEVPACSLTLPVISKWSYPDLKIAPCRYKGSAYLDNMIIAAHNYPSHFGNLKNLQPMDAIVFTDIDGNSFRYQVVEKEVLKSTAIEEMEAGEWDLTLFTCTIGGADRITIRCEKTE